jgi:hypothetical protein
VDVEILQLCLLSFDHLVDLCFTSLDVIMLLLDDTFGKVVCAINFFVVFFDMSLLVVKLHTFLIDDLGHVIDLLRSHWSLALVSSVRHFRSAECNSSSSSHSCEWLGHLLWQSALIANFDIHHASSTA